MGGGRRGVNQNDVSHRSTYRIMNSNARRGGELLFDFSTSSVNIKFLFFSCTDSRQKWIESKIEIRVNEICETLMIVASGMVIETSTWLPSLGVGSVENRERRGNNIQIESAHQMRAKWAGKKKSSQNRTMYTNYLAWAIIIQWTHWNLLYFTSISKRIF